MVNGKIQTGADVKNLRLKFGKTQAQLAELAETSQTRISAWENGAPLSKLTRFRFEVIFQRLELESAEAC